ncbi:hypothetical protein A4X03_0g2633 [Tilletia caries]|nr:hypothetical protein A4X03_0g2633 [Tilletia caries]
MAKITKELAAGRYCGPFSQEECSHYLGGPFQTSPVSLAPKPPDGWRFIQDASFPIKDATQPSINSQIDSDNWPCTWAGIAVAIWQVLQLPITAQAGARDVRSAYRTIPLHPAQWPAAVVQWDGNFYVDKALAFGISSSAGAWGVVGDALADVLRAHGVGPVLKWVDDFLFFRVPRQHLPQLNHARLQLYAKVQPTRRGGSIYWTDGEHQLCEDFRRPLRDLEGPADWAYSFADVDRVCAPLGVPWSEEKEQQFGPSFTYYGVEFSIPDRIISLPDRKRAGLVDKIRSWRASPSHTREEAESLLGKLQFATHVVPNGRQYLTGLVNFLRMHARSSDRRAPARRSFASATLRPPSRVRRDLEWWSEELARSPVARSFSNDLCLHDPGLYTDACGSGAGVVLAGCVAAYSLDSSWREGGRDIMWAEAVGAELGLHHLVASGTPDGPVRVYVDNTAVEAGFRNGRVQNEAANECLERVFHFASLHNIVVRPAHVTSQDNPADGPSRGAPSDLPALPPITIPAELQSLVHRIY